MDAVDDGHQAVGNRRRRLFGSLKKSRRDIYQSVNQTANRKRLNLPV
ncbi:hypothetical protein ABENE_22195 [Asticcacaulis benevestitus DSM 16100 = ATCC BAA-896]|uniref:Uncharacterized protein n=1 Tax=Asticcacaulis benevestitus DSM 16100 = ATCC BAA-896 TaxID=1121022 RepID=V4P2J3_9CAUL|nr:hypothetical protein ABENE_22195 [Asticcacaulis benevestitus DSM 16100 = ATCC BAA-896]